MEFDPAKLSAFGFWPQLGAIIFLLWAGFAWKRYKDRGDAFEAIFHTLSPEVLRITLIIAAVFTILKGLIKVASLVL